MTLKRAVLVEYEKGHMIGEDLRTEAGKEVKKANI